MTDYQETLNDKWNDTKRRLESLEKRMDVMSDKLNMVSSKREAMRADAIKKRMVNM